MLKEDTVESWLSDQGYNEADAKYIVAKMRQSEELGGDVHELNLRLSYFSGYSGIYTNDLMERIENTVRKMLNDEVGFLNDKHERNYTITRSGDV